MFLGDKDLGCCDEASIKAESGPEQVNEDTFFDDELFATLVENSLDKSGTLTDLMS